tara:strand:+ start:100 stop:864 length:765 start_codon:yes stop_codon:yes gene_type:complete
MNYSVSIMTFSERLEPFKNIFTKIKSQREDIECTVIINGNLNEPFDEKYRKEILEFLTPFKNTFPIMFPEYRSMAKKWNTACQMSRQDNVLVFHDDIDILDNFMDDFENIFPEYEGECFIINQDMGAIVLNKQRMHEVNWFDERYLSMGDEDGDFHSQYCAKYGYRTKIISIPSCIIEKLPWQINLVKDESIKLNRLPGQRTHRIGGPENSFKDYSLFNREISDPIRRGLPAYGVSQQQQYPYEEYFWKNKDKI